jgi:hypothetical protein
MRRAMIGIRQTVRQAASKTSSGAGLDAMIRKSSGGALDGVSSDRMKQAGGRA